MARLAAQQEVSVEHYLAVVAARKKFRQARKERAFTPRTKQGVSQEYLYAGEGRFHELLRILNMSQEDFSRLAGLSYETVRSWYGFPMHGWQVALLEALAHNKAMADFLVSRGWDPAKFKPAPLRPYPSGHYPRTTQQGRELLGE